MGDDYFLAPLDPDGIDHVIALLKRGYGFSTGDRGVRRLAYRRDGFFTSSFLDNVADRAAANALTEEALREHLAREPRHLYDAFIVDSLLREAYRAFEQGALDEAEHGFINALERDTKEWAPHLGLCLVSGARSDLDLAHRHLTQAIEGFSRPFFHFFRYAFQQDPRDAPDAYAAFLTQILTIAPTCAPAYRQRADAHRWAGDEAAARADLEMAARLANAP